MKLKAEYIVEGLAGSALCHTSLAGIEGSTSFNFFSHISLDPANTAYSDTIFVSQSP